MTALIAEDETAQRQEMASLLRQHWPELSIVAECADGHAALQALNDRRPTLAFLDIRMPGPSGLEVARAAAARTHIVFVTAYDEHAIAAFEAGAADYLLKPIKAERLVLTIQRLKDRLAAGSPPDFSQLLQALENKIRPREPSHLKWVTACLGDTVRMFPIDEVLFFQAQEKYVRVVTARDEAYIRTPLKELLAQLDPEVFWQVHRSTIVRAAAIDRVKRDALGHLHAQVRGVEELLPISSAFQTRFRGM
jgi:DNA-binding LytR/AlgR family response regulator